MQEKQVSRNFPWNLLVSGPATGRIVFFGKKRHFFRPSVVRLSFQLQGFFGLHSEQTPFFRVTFGRANKNLECSLVDFSGRREERKFLHFLRKEIEFWQFANFTEKGFL